MSQRSNALIYILLLCGLLVFAVEANSAQPRDADVAGPSEEPGGKSVKGYQVIIERNLFLLLGTDLEAQQTVSDFNKLALTVMYDDGRSKALFVNKKTGQVSYVAEGEILDSGAQVAEISDKSAKLVKDGQEMMRGMNVIYTGSSDRSRRRRPADERERRVQEQSGTERTTVPQSGQKFKVGTPEWREAFKKRKLEELGIYRE